MFARAVWLLCLTCLGCQAMLGTPPSRMDPDDSPSRLNQPSGGSDLAAASAFAAAVQPSPGNIAAESLADAGNERACAHLIQFAAAAPENAVNGLVQAELLFTQGRHDEAREQYEQTIAACQEAGEQERRRLLHCHAKLLALAQALDDEYEVQLQRGIGLWLLAQERAGLGDPAGDVPVEGLLCKAAACLAKAHAVRCDQARPCWYLYEVWRQLGQPHLANRWLKLAQNAALFSSLTPQEHRQLLLSSQSPGD